MSTMSELQEFLTSKVAKQNLEFSTDRDLWKAEAERMTSGYNEAQSQLAALREELANAKAWVKQHQKDRDTAQQRLADAERRNGELEVLLMNTAEVLRSGNGYGWEDAQADIIDAALNPNPEATSHE